MKLEQLRTLGWKDGDIVQLLEELLEKVKTGSSNIMESELSEQTDNPRELSKRVTQLLKKIGVPFHCKGMEYTRTAIIYCIESGNTYVPMTTELYPEIAKIYGSTPSRVERAIRYVRERCFGLYNEERDEVFGNYINSRTGNPTNQEFIVTLVDYILQSDNLR